MSDSAIPFRSLFGHGNPAALMRRGGVAVACLGSIFALSACERKVDAPAFVRPPASVTAEAAIARDVPIYLEEIGRTAAVEIVNVQPQVTGRIDSIDFDDGMDVTIGKPLFTIDPRWFKMDLAQADAVLAQRKTEKVLADQEFKRVQGLVEKKAVSEQEFEQRKNAVAVAQAVVNAAQANVDTATLNIGYTSIKSTINGRAGQRRVDKGNIVKANQDTLVTIQRLDPIYAEFTTPEGNLPEIRRRMAEKAAEKTGDKALKVEIWLPNEPNNRRAGKLTFIETAVQPGTGTIKLRAEVPNPEMDRHFWPQQFVNVRLILETRPKAVLVPAPAVQIAQQGPFVYVVKPDSTAELRPVVQGQRQGGLVVIEKGVEAEENVIVTGQMAVAPGAKVNVLPPPTTAPSTTTTAPSTTAPSATQPASQPAAGRSSGK